MATVEILTANMNEATTDQSELIMMETYFSTVCYHWLFRWDNLERAANQQHQLVSSQFIFVIPIVFNCESDDSIH
jgi:hypothetical protein